MGAAKQIKQVMIERGVSVKDLANLLQIHPQSMSTKLYRDSLSFAEVQKIADLLNCDICFITRDSKKVF